MDSLGQFFFDQDPQFIADFTRKLYFILGIKLTTLIAYHLQTNGQTKYFNQELEGYLPSQHQDNWDGLLPLGEFTHKNHIHSSVQHMPFMINSG
jgi:hypothetical protein